MRDKSLNMDEKLIGCQSGATLILMATIFSLMLISLALVVDIGRMYAVQSKARNASDAALLGGVSTISTLSLNEEVGRLFAANFPANYMGATVSNFAISEIAEGVFEMTFTVTVPTLLMDMFGSNTSSSISILSQVTKGFSITPNQRLELALVLDNTGSMGGPRIAALRQASKDLVNILYGDASTLSNIVISVVPYDALVNIGPGHENWIQSGFRADYAWWGSQGSGFASNRNGDIPGGATVSDSSDLAPHTESTRFRGPNNIDTGSCNDFLTPQLPRMAFGLNDKGATLAMLDTMIAAGCTRINVGLLWGWMALSPNWQGMWDAGKPNLPAPASPLLDKTIVLMTDGHNTVYIGANGQSDDNESTRLLCATVKAHGITIYTIGFGDAAGVNEPLLRNCASRDTYYFRAPTAEQLRTVFRQIADDIVFNTLRLSK